MVLLWVHALHVGVDADMPRIAVVKDLRAKPIQMDGLHACQAKALQPHQILQILLYRQLWRQFYPQVLLRTLLNLILLTHLFRQQWLHFNLQILLRTLLNRILRMPLYHQLRRQFYPQALLQTLLNRIPRFRLLWLLYQLLPILRMGTVAAL